MCSTACCYHDAFAHVQFSPIHAIDLSRVSSGSMASMKRSLEIDDLSMVPQASPCKSAKVQGVILQLSPMKGRYFDGRLGDDKATIRMVGFDIKKQQELTNMREKQQSVILENCQLKQSKFTDETELILTSSTKVALSERKFDVCAASEILLNILETLPDHQVVCVKARVTKESKPVEVKPGLMKQNYTIADSSGCAQLVLWQDDMGKLSVGESYKCDGLIVQSFSGSKFLTPPKSGWSLSRCDDIDLDESTLCDEIENKVISDAYVAGVMKIEVMVSCLSCKATFASTSIGKVGKCTRCMMSQQISRCRCSLSAKLLVTKENEDSHVLSVYLPMIRAITKNENLSEDSDIDEVTMQLLEAENFDLIHENGMIISVIRN